MQDILEKEVEVKEKRLSKPIFPLFKDSKCIQLLITFLEVSFGLKLYETGTKQKQLVKSNVDQISNVNFHSLTDSKLLQLAENDVF